ncbi:MAG TPA: hypothetical protein VIY29_12920 [Ktedonobacteraceae bacterium]
MITAFFLSEKEGILRDGLSAFVPILEQTDPRYLFPRVLASYRAGTPLSFGTLTVSSSGITNYTSAGNAELAWGSFQAIEVDKQKGGITGEPSHSPGLPSLLPIHPTSPFLRL